jgi:hypothetical protein
VGTLSPAHAKAISGLETAGAVGQLSLGISVGLSGLEAAGSVGSLSVGGAERARVTQAYFELPANVELARVSQAYFELPSSAEWARVSQAYFEIPQGIAAVSAQKPAGGRPSRRRRKPVLVEIDGQQFVIRSEHEAAQLADAASKVATQIAEEQAKVILSKRQKKSRKSSLNTSPFRLSEPEITVRPLNDGSIDEGWLSNVAERMDAVLEAYRSVAENNEIALLLNLHAQLDEEDALVALLLTI